MELNFGKGKILVFQCRRVDEDDNIHWGILLRQTDKEHPINSPLPHFDMENYEIKESDLILWFSNIESARVVQNAINSVCLRFDEYDIIDLNIR